MDQALNFSLSYAQLTREAEDAIKKCNLNQGGMGYTLELGKTSAILSFWYGLALQGYPGTIMDERVDADRLRLHVLIYKLRIVSLDVPTSWQALSEKDPSQADPIPRAVITAINNMLIDLMAAMSHKDGLIRRQRQKQGIERAHTLGRYRGKQADQERHQKVLYYRQIKKLSIRETADATGYSTSQVCRIQAFYKEVKTD
ncbi:TPA: hypothetical protein ACX37D_000922 [Serratia marcescens]